MATITKQTIRVDLTPGRVYPVLHVSQGDVGLEALEFYVYQNGQPFTIPSEVTTINIDGMTPVGVFSYPCTWTSNVVTAGLTATMTAERGIDICELALYDATNNKIGTCNFVIAVEESPYTNAHVSTSDMATIMAAASSAQQYELLAKSWAVGDTGIRTGENTNNSEYWAEISESWAVGGTGKRTGEDTNNSEYWSTISHQYANTISFKTYDTVAQMKADTGLLDGGVCRTLGYYAANDGGEALYRIANTAPSTIYETLSNGRYACLIYDKAINVKQVGAKGDGVTDDADAIQNAINKGQFKTVYVPQGAYLISKPIKIPGSSYTVRGAGRTFTTIKKITNTGDSGSVTTDYGVTYDYSEGSVFLVKTAGSDNTFSNITIAGFSIDCENVNHAIFAPFVTYSVFEELRINKPLTGITSQGWCNSFKNIQIFDSQRSKSMHIVGSPIFIADNVQSNRGSLEIVNSNGCVNGCAFDNGNPSYHAVRSNISLNGCDCETYNYPFQFSESTGVINGGRFELHYSEGVALPTRWIRALTGSLVTVNSAKIEWENYVTEENVDSLAAVVTSSVIEGNIIINVGSTFQVNTSGYVKLNGEIKSLDRYVKNRKLVKTKADNTVTFSVAYRDPKVAHIDVIVQAYEKQAHILGDLFITNTSGTAVVTENTISVKSNSANEVPTVNITIDGTNVTLTITSSNYGNIQKMYGFIEY